MYNKSKVPHQSKTKQNQKFLLHYFLKGEARILLTMKLTLKNVLPCAKICTNQANLDENLEVLSVDLLHIHFSLYQKAKICICVYYKHGID